MLKKRFEGISRMSDALYEAQSLLREYISPPIAGEPMKVRIYRAARHVGFTISRTNTLWYGNARRIDAGEIDVLRAAVRGKAEPKTTVAADVTSKSIWEYAKGLEQRLEQLETELKRAREHS
jgi:hypothetical protein